jgi:hypothetical protein
MSPKIHPVKIFLEKDVRQSGFRTGDRGQGSGRLKKSAYLFRVNSICRQKSQYYVEKITQIFHFLVPDSRLLPLDFRSVFPSIT